MSTVALCSWWYFSIGLTHSWQNHYHLLALFFPDQHLHSNVQVYFNVCLMDTISFRFSLKINCSQLIFPNLEWVNKHTFFYRWSWWRTEHDKSTGIPNFSFPLKKSQKAMFPPHHPLQPLLHPLCPHQQPPLSLANLATTTRSERRSHRTQVAQTRPGESAPGARKMEKIGKVTVAWIT